MSNQLHSTSPYPQVKICDFGVAEELDPFSQTDTIKGSQGAPMFIAPEIAVGKDVFSGHKLDVWSAGVSLYNFVTGNYPFNADNVFKLYRKIGEGKYVIPDYLPENLKNLLEVNFIVCILCQLIIEYSGNRCCLEIRHIVLLKIKIPSMYP